MKANQATYPVRVMSRLLGVSASGFYAWVTRPASARAREDLRLTALIHRIHRRSGGAYGAPSIHAELADDHHTQVGKKRVARLMRAAGLRGASSPRPSLMPRPPALGTKSIDNSPLMGQTACGSPTSPTSRPGPGSCISRSCSTSGRGGSSAGPWHRTCARSWCLRPSTWRSRSAVPRPWSITRIAAASTPAMPSGSAAGKPA